MKFPSFSEFQLEATAVICGAMAFFFELIGNRALFAVFGIPAAFAAVWAFLTQSSKPNWKPKLNWKEGKTKVNAIIKLVAIALVVSLIGFAFAMVAQEYIMPQGATVVNPPPAITATLVDQPWTNDTSVDWGELEAGEDKVFGNFTVTNVSEEQITLTWINIDLPAEWILTWTPNATILEPTEVAIGLLTLNVSDTATADTYEWTSKLTVT